MTLLAVAIVSLRTKSTRLKAVSCKPIDDARLLKHQLMEELSDWMAEHHLKQSGAAPILTISRPQLSDVKTPKFTIDTLLKMLSRAGKPVKLAIGWPAEVAPRHECCLSLAQRGWERDWPSAVIGGVRKLLPEDSLPPGFLEAGSTDAAFATLIERLPRRSQTSRRFDRFIPAALWSRSLAGLAFRLPELQDVR
jgi:predicted XRE-type DNA-binding protein